MKIASKKINASFFRKKPVLIGIIVCLVLGALVLLLNRDPLRSLETQRALKGDVEEVVIESGIVEPAKMVDLIIERPGTISEIYVQEGDVVEKGQILAQIDNRSAFNEVSSAQARLQGELARLSELMNGASASDALVIKANNLNAGINIESAESQRENSQRLQDELVESARDALYSTDIRAYLIEGGREDGEESFVPPVITGSYRGDEGVYRIKLYPSASKSGYSFTYSGLEQGRGIVSTSEPQPLGNRGLFIQFPPRFARGIDVVWEIQIPNTRSANYTQLSRAYEQALINRETVTNQVQNNLKSAQVVALQSQAQGVSALLPARSERILQQEALVAQARSALSQAQLSLSHTTLRAPFDGLITNIGIVEGQYATIGFPSISLISDSQFEIVVQIPETDIRNVQVGDEATVTFDAYRGDEFNAVVVSINPAAENVGGVRSFKTTLQFVDNDDRIRSGLTADIEIISEVKKDVVTIPSRAVFEKNGNSFVRIRDANGDINEVSIVTGLRGSDGIIEVKKGINVDDEVITFLTDDQLDELGKRNSEN